MPYTQQLPEWKAAGIEPPQSKKTDGWGIGDRPPADWWNWLLNRSYRVLAELQADSIHKEQKGAAGGVATLDADGKVPQSQLNIQPPAPASLTTAGIVKLEDSIASTSNINAATPNSVKKAYDKAAAAIPGTDKGKPGGVATLDEGGKVPAAQLPSLGSGNIDSGSVTNDKLAPDVKVGSLAALKTVQKTSLVGAINEIRDDNTNHAGRKDNPHGVTKAQVGLGNVTNDKQATETEFIAHKTADAPHQYGGKMEFRYNAAAGALDLVMLP